MSNSTTPAGSASSTMQIGLDTPSHRQHGKLSLLPQDAHPTLGSHPLQYFLLLQVKTLCFSWILAHQGLLPVHRQKNHKEYLKPQELWCSGLSHTSFPWRNKWLAYPATKGVAYGMPVGTNHSTSSPAYHPPTTLSSLAVSQKAGRSDTLWKSRSGSAHSFT